MEAAQSVDDYMFDEAIRSCRQITENTSYLEILSYSNPEYNSVEERPLEMKDFEDFLHRREAFSPPSLPDNVHLVAGVRLIFQKNAKHNETFAPRTISFASEAYSSMVHAFHLPRMAIETSSVVGPFFWYEVDHDDDGKAFLQIIFRKSDVRKKGKTRGWELILSHDFSTGITSGFCKGTPSSDIVSGVEQLRKCASDIEHAMLLPLIIIGHESSAKTDQKQRDVRDWLRRLENAISLRAAGDSEHFDGYHSEKFGIDLDSINRDLVECQAQVLWKSPVAFISIIRSMEDAARLFMETVPEERKSPNMRRFQKRMISRLHLYGAKWAGIETFANTTMQRLEIQRSALYNIIAQKDSKVNLQMASDQKMLAHLSRQDSEAMKGISILGAIFLPGTFLASIFSTTFFDFNDAPDMASVVSPRFWIFWAVTVPFTLIVVGLYFYWERRRAASNEQGEANLYQDIQALEASIMETMRKRTMAKANIWTERISRKEAMAADNDNDYGAFRLPTVPVSSNYLEVPPANV